MEVRAQPFAILSLLSSLHGFWSWDLGPLDLLTGTNLYIFCS